jgi:peptide deformylase
MTLAIAQLGQPVLRRAADPIALEAVASEPFRRLVAEMLETLGQAGGAGLAAPQVFVSLRLFLAVIELPGEGDEPAVEVFVNPRIVSASPEKESDWEGCLSFPELSVLVPRHRAVRVEYLDIEGVPQALDLEGFAARVVQHEYDHIEGILTLDRAASTHDIVKVSELDAVRQARAGGTTRDQ